MTETLVYRYVTHANATALGSRRDEVFSARKVRGNFRRGSVRMENTGRDTDIRHDSQLIPHFADVSADKFELASARQVAECRLAVRLAPVRARPKEGSEEGTAPVWYIHVREVHAGHAERTRRAKNKKLHFQAGREPPPIEKNTNHVRSSVKSAREMCVERNKE